MYHGRRRVRLQTSLSLSHTGAPSVSTCPALLCPILPCPLVRPCLDSLFFALCKCRPCEIAINSQANATPTANQLPAAHGSYTWVFVHRRFRYWRAHRHALGALHPPRSVVIVHMLTFLTLKWCITMYTIICSGAPLHKSTTVAGTCDGCPGHFQLMCQRISSVELGQTGSTHVLSLLEIDCSFLSLSASRAARSSACARSSSLARCTSS